MTHEERARLAATVERARERVAEWPRWKREISVSSVTAPLEVAVPTNKHEERARELARTVPGMFALLTTKGPAAYEEIAQEFGKALQQVERETAQKCAEVADERARQALDGVKHTVPFSCGHQGCISHRDMAKMARGIASQIRAAFPEER